MDTEAWGQLVSLTDIETDPVTLKDSSFTFGRGKDCDMSYGNNKLVSNKHCSIVRDTDGTVWLCDSSTNGTLLNLKVKITKGNKKELHHGDEFYIVYKKGDEEKNIGFIYQSMEELAKETSVSESDATQEYETDANIMDATVADIDVNILEEEENSQNKQEETSRKRQKKSVEKDESEPKEKVVKKDEKDAELEKKENKPCDSTEVPPSDKDKSKEEISQEEKSKLKSDGKEKPTEHVVDEIEETLMCSICQELLYNCVSLQPCMHSYCAGCYSDWMKKSNECPTCRLKVKRINKNYIVNNLIEAYLKEHPEKKRPEEDLKELDAKNKITKDMLTPTAQHSYDADEDYTDSDEDEEEEESRPTAAYVPPPPPMLFGFGTPLFGTRVAPTKCRQCPGYIPPPTAPGPGILQTVGTVLGINKGDNQTAGPATEKKDDTGDNVNEEGAGPSTEKKEEEVDPELRDEKTMLTPPQFTCGINQNHVLCQCCLQPMPDRRLEAMDGTDRVPPQQCTICYRSYCHAYWGCTKNECQGCIGKFKDLNFGKKCLNNLILENIHESEIFKNYLEAHGITVKKVLRDSLAKLDSGQYTCPDKGRWAINANTAMCYTCGLRNFKELAYQYRRDIPLDQLPEEVRKRECCYWGRNCRTQRTRPHHAQNFSHICEQIRTT